ncbi:MAG TPA: OmpH family outer membrane protein [Mucilaginibacter sp.]|jgi:outer membrane protein|nr:OmpH family outer membrane protein [Mucilaginibacter sp.]
MKKLMKVFLVGFSILLTGNIASAQNKIGYINLNQLIDQMSETKTIRTQIEAYQKQFIDELTAMNNDYQSKGKAYEAQRATLSDAQRTAKESELAAIQKRMNDYQTTAQQQVQNKTNELSKPLFDKVRAAVAQVGKEKGYTYVFDTSQTDFIVSPPGDDLMAAVKAKLGIK